MNNSNSYISFSKMSELDISAYQIKEDPED